MVCTRIRSMSLRQSVPHRIQFAAINNEIAAAKIADASAHGKRVIVCGGRAYDDAATLFAVLDTVHRRRGIKEVIQGGARGADSLAGEWAVDRGVKMTLVAADWNKYRRRAGPIRNQKMLDLKPDAVIAFPGGSGTDHMMSIARVAGITVWEPLKREEVEFPNRDPITSLE